MHPIQICAYIFYADFFNLCTSWHFHPAFYHVIFQNAHKNRWMETQLVTALKYETKMFQKFITCLFDNSYISYIWDYVYALFF